MQAAANETLIKLVQEQVTSLVRESLSVQRHTKRGRFHQIVVSGNHHNSQSKVNNKDKEIDSNAKTNETDKIESKSEKRVKIRRILQADDVNLALQWRGDEKIYSCTALSSHSEHNDDIHHDQPIDLNAYLNSEPKQFPPSEIGMTVHWLAVDGIQPRIPQNPAHYLPTPNHDAILSRIQNDVNEEDDDDDNEDDPNNTNNNTNAIINSKPNTSSSSSSSISIRHLLPRLLAEELQLYFTRVTLAIERGNPRQQDSALLSIQRDAGIQELVPFLTRFISRQIYDNIGQTEYCRLLIRLVHSLLYNPHLHLELHLHQILPSLITCVVAKKLTLDDRFDNNHWLLRDEAAMILSKACVMFGEQYTTLKARVIKTLCEAIEPGKPLGSIYGGIVGISCFGPKAIDAFILPLATQFWTQWETSLETETNKHSRYNLYRCQDAILRALAIFLKSVTLVEQSKRLDYHGLSDIFGEKLIPIQSNSDRTGYISCFV